MYTKIKEIRKELMMWLSVLLLAGLPASTAYAEHDTTVDIHAEVKTHFTVTFEFYRDPDGNDTGWGTLIGTNSAPTLIFNVGNFDPVYNVLRSSELFRIFASVKSNDGKSRYELSHEANLLEQNGIRIPADSFVVASYVDSGEGRDAGVGTGITATPVTQNQILYQSDANGKGVGVHILYAIKDIGLDVPAGTYTGSLKITLNQIQ